MGDEHGAADAAGGMIGGSASNELASNRTGMAFERTSLASDRTLMAMVRTSLSMISFGFTIYKFFEQMNGPVASNGSRYFGASLLYLGVGLLVFGILSYWRFNRNLAKRNKRLTQMGLLRETAVYVATPTFFAALLLLAVGLGGIVAIILKI